jgi:hypothetical protein
LLKLHALFIAEPMTAPALSPEQLMDGGALRMWQMLSPKTQTNLKNAKSYFAEHLAIGDYYATRSVSSANGLAEARKCSDSRVPLPRMTS